MRLPCASSGLCSYHSALKPFNHPEPAMRRTLLIAVLLTSFLSPTLALAAKWVDLGSKAQARIEIDASSVPASKEGSLRIWHRESYAKPKIPDSGAFSFSRLTTLTEFQCEKRTATSIQTIYSSENGTELKTENSDSREARPIAPDSALEAVFAYACKPRPKPAAPVIKEAPPPPPVVEPVVDSKKSKSSKKAKEDEHAEAPHWTYSGPTGTEKWGTLSPEFATCGTGQRQSPIDIRRTVRADLPSIGFAYKPVPLSIVDNGHSIKVDTPGAGGITVEGESYDLVQFDFHKPSEVKINGKAYDMAVHMIHQSKAGKLAVVAVMIEAGKEQSLIRTLWTHLPLEQNTPVSRPEVKIDPTQLLPAKRNYYTFLGSLTTPPCSEGVLWLVLKTPLAVSKEQLAGFGTIYKSNVRPVQAVNNRLIKESR